MKKQKRMSSEDIKPKTGSFEIAVPSESVRERRDFGSFEIVDTETGILFHVRGGYDIFVQPRMASLYLHLRYLLDNFDAERSEEERQMFDSVFNATVTNMEIPMFMASKDSVLFDIAANALRNLNELSEEAMNAPLQPETPEENGEFERRIDALNEIDKAEAED